MRYFSSQGKFSSFNDLNKHKIVIINGERQPGRSYLAWRGRRDRPSFSRACTNSIWPPASLA
jgi:hypothetical protein